MPALQPEYDYYEYARRRQGTVNRAVPYSATKNINKTPVNSRNNKKNLNLKTSTTRDVTKNATRIATRDDNFIASKRKTSVANKTSKQRNISKKTSIDPVIFDRKKNLKKPQEMTLTKPKANIKNKAMQKQKARVKEMLKNFVVVSMVFGMFFLICYRYSIINELFSEVNDLKTEVKNKQIVNAQLESNIKQDTDLAYIENYAKTQLRNAKT